MRAAGFHVEDYDPFSNPARPVGRFDLVTCFEVIEHSTAPAETVADMDSFLAEGGAILFSQPLQPANIEEIRASWWYIGPRNGHVSIYTADALATLAARCGLAFHLGQGISAFAHPTPSPASRHLLADVGLPYAFLRLEAPGNQAGLGATSDGCWHALEQTDPWRCRWTAVPRLAWSGLLPKARPANVRVVVPFVHQVVPDFAAGCGLEIGGRPVPVAVGQARLTADFVVTADTPDTITLITPELGVPQLLRGSADSRPLGLAIPVYPWTGAAAGRL